MNTFTDVLHIADTLLGPKGCAWDQEQTLDSLKPHLLEEVHELLEAIDLKEHENIKEELGDCFYVLVFLGKLMEKNRICTLPEVFSSLAEKLIRRHPHVFGELEVKSTEETIQNWEKTKKQEGKKNPIEGIPPGLPALARAQKIILKLRRAKKESFEKTGKVTEEELGEKLWQLVEAAESSGIDAESALRRLCLMYEKNRKH